MKKTISILLLFVLLAGAPGLQAAGDEKSGQTIVAPRKNLGRALLFNGTYMLIFSIKYWIKYSKWIEDWQYELKWDDQKERFFTLKANHFDSNPFVTNWTHSLAGGVYYTYGRYHRLSSLGSFIFGTVSSLVWEYVTEWREVISVNDNFMTCVGGLAIGEPLFQFSNYFRNRRGILNRLLQTVFNPAVTVIDLAGGRRGRVIDAPELIFPPRFDFYLGRQTLQVKNGDEQTMDLTALGIRGRIISIPGYGEPGQIKRKLTDTLVSDVSLEVMLGPSQVEEYRFSTRALLFGRIDQDLREDGNGNLWGRSFFFGASSAFDVYKKKALVDYDKGEYHFDFTHDQRPPQPTQFTDKIAAMNLLGPSLDLSLYAGNAGLHLSADASVDFALVCSNAVNAYSTVHDLFNPRLKTTLTHYGYYYAFGFTLQAALSAHYRAFEWGGRIKYQHYDSIEGIDRFQYQVEDDANLTDSRLLYRADLSWALGKSPLKLTFGYEWIERQGTLKEISRETSEHRFFGQLFFAF